MLDPYNDIHRSILALCKKVLIDNSIVDFQVFDFEAHAAEQKMPDKDLIGISEYSIENQTDMYSVTCMIVVVTKSDDAGLKRLRSAIGKLFGTVKPNKRFPVYNLGGAQLGELTVEDGVMVGPVGEAEARPVQAIAVSFGVGYKDLSI
jgi:hypothetical protein